MANHMSNVSSGMTKFLRKLKPDSLVSIAYFNENVTYMYRMVHGPSILNIDTKIINYGMTALYDSVSFVIRDFMSMTNFLHHLYIITDGDDNYSKYNTKNSVQELCSVASRHNWSIVHCSTEIDKLVPKNVTFSIDTLESMMENMMM